MPGGKSDRWQPPYENLRHYFFDMGNDTLLAFFEYPKGLAKQNRDLPGGMQHIAFHVPRERFDRMVEHVKSCGIKVVGPVSLGGRFWSAYFLDNNGIRLELTQAARELLIKEGYDPQYGARPMRRAIQRFIQDPLALKLLNGEFQDGDTVEVDADSAANELRFQKLVGQDSSPARVLQDPLPVG